MSFTKAYIPYGAYWSTPFCKWQGSFSNFHPMRFAAECAARALREKEIATESLDGVILGMTIPAKSSFYGGPWTAALLGAPGLTGPMISQACATSARCVYDAAASIETNLHKAELVVTADKTSNGPHLYYPNPTGPGGMGDKEDWVWDNFSRDPFAKNSMIQTAENVAKEAGVDRAAQEDVTLLRHQQYQDALKGDAAFLKRFFLTPIEINPSGRKVIATVNVDEGVFPSSKEGLERLKPVLPDGTITFGTQTYPADGNAGVIVADRETAARLSREKGIQVRILSYAEARTKKGFMAMAVVPASEKALAEAGIGVADLQAVKTHNPFAVNDVYMGRKMDIPQEKINRYGSSLIWGHPQGPTGVRLVIEMVEELVLAGGGNGLFVGCAAGDTAAALVVRVDVA